MVSSSVFVQVFSGEFGWPLLVVLTMGLSSMSMCSSVSVVIVFLCVGGKEGSVSLG